MGAFGLIIFIFKLLHYWDNKMSKNDVVHQQSIHHARVIDCNKVSYFAPFHWLSLASKDFIATPLLSLIYGVLFSVLPMMILILFAVDPMSMQVIPLVVGFALIGPVFSTGLYDLAWALEKGQISTFSHSVKVMFSNQDGLQGFSIALLFILTLWTLIAGLIFTLYPNMNSPTMMELSVFFGLGAMIAGILLFIVLVIAAFTPQIILERKIDIMTAIFTSANAVKVNFGVMCLWSGIMLLFGMIGFLTSAIAFVVILPLLSFASWHAYIAVIKTKKARDFE